MVVNKELNNVLILVNRVLHELENGFVPCPTCGNQEATKDLDCVDDLRAMKAMLIRMDKPKIETDLEKGLDQALFNVLNKTNALENSEIALNLANTAKAIAQFKLLENS